MPNTVEDAESVFRSFGADPQTACHQAAEVIHSRDALVPKILRLVARYPGLGPALASPVVGVDGRFTQDRVISLGEVFEEAHSDEMLALFGRYTQCFLDCWEYGIHDYLYNLDANNGLNGDRVVLLDFGEVALFTPLVRSWVAERSWSAKFADSPEQQSVIPQSLHRDYTRIMNSRLTVEAFDLSWARMLTDLDRDLISPPALRDRREQIPALAERLLDRARYETGTTVSGFSAAALTRLQEHPWGLAVQLDHAIHTALASCTGSVIEPSDLAWMAPS